MPMYVEGNPKSKKAVKDMIASGKKVYLFNQDWVGNRHAMGSSVIFAVLTNGTEPA